MQLANSIQVDVLLVVFVVVHLDSQQEFVVGKPTFLCDSFEHCVEEEESQECQNIE